MRRRSDLPWWAPQPPVCSLTRRVDRSTWCRRPSSAQTLLDELCAVAEPGQRFLVAQGDRADDTLVAGLRRAGHPVTAVVAYRTVLRVPDRRAIDGADAVLFASGSAAAAWFDAFGTVVPPVVVSIGPTTTGMAQRLGLKVTSTAADHSLDGLVTELVRILDAL